MVNYRTSFFPPKATFTEANLPDQSGKVFIVTGSSSGLGKALSKILYQKNAKIYIAARSETKAMAAIEEMKNSSPNSKGQLVYLHLDLSDLRTIKRSAQEFLAKESRLDVLWNNAGVMVPEQGSKTVQGYELQLGVNVLGGFLFTHFLHPILAATAKTAPKNSIRVIWISSGFAAVAPKPAIDFDNINYEKDEGPWTKYMRSKAGNVLHAAEFGRRAAAEGIISMSVHPGVFKTDLQRTLPWWMKFFLRAIMHDPIEGAYAELFAGLSPDITEKDNKVWVAPFGRLEAVREDFLDEKLGRKFWEWSEEQSKPYWS